MMMMKQRCKILAVAGVAMLFQAQAASVSASDFPFNESSVGAWYKFTHKLIPKPGQNDNAKQLPVPRAIPNDAIALATKFVPSTKTGTPNWSCAKESTTSPKIFIHIPMQDGVQTAKTECLTTTKMIGYEVTPVLLPKDSIELIRKEVVANKDACTVLAQKLQATGANEKDVKDLVKNWGACSVLTQKFQVLDANEQELLQVVKSIVKNWDACTMLLANYPEVSKQEGEPEGGHWKTKGLSKQKIAIGDWIQVPYELHAGVKRKFGKGDVGRINGMGFEKDDKDLKLMITVEWYQSNKSRTISNVPVKNFKKIQLLKEEYAKKLEKAYKLDKEETERETDDPHTAATTKSCKKLEVSDVEEFYKTKNKAFTKNPPSSGNVKEAEKARLCAVRKALVKLKSHNDNRLQLGQLEEVGKATTRRRLATMDRLLREIHRAERV